MIGLPYNARLKRLPVWPVWAALVAAVGTSFVSNFAIPTEGIVVMTITILGRQTLLRSVARVYPVKRVVSRRVRKLICVSPLVFGMGWSLIVSGVTATRMIAGHRRDDGDLLLSIWGQCVVALFIAIHIFNLGHPSARRRGEIHSHP